MSLTAPSCDEMTPVLLAYVRFLERSSHKKSMSSAGMDVFSAKTFASRTENSDKPCSFARNVDTDTPNSSAIAVAVIPLSNLACSGVYISYLLSFDLSNN